MCGFRPVMGRGTGHGQRGDVLVTRLGDDPIHAGMPRAWLSPDMEVYYYARGPAERLQVLAYARDSDPKLGLLWPVEWTTTYGKGRVYISTYGHVWPGDVQAPGLRDAAVQTIIPRALEWLARRPVTLSGACGFSGHGRGFGSRQGTPGRFEHVDFCPGTYETRTAFSGTNCGDRSRNTGDQRTTPLHLKWQS